MQINKDNIRKNGKIVDHDYKVGDKVVLTNDADFKYETPYNFQFEITHCWKNVMVKLQCGAIKIRHNIRFIKPFTSEINVEKIKC